MILSKGIGIIRKFSSFLPQKSLVALYYTLIYPYFHYGNTVWANCFPTNDSGKLIFSQKLNKLIILQKRIIRVITFSKFNDHTQPLFHKLNIVRFQYINFIESAMLIFKTLKNVTPDTLDLTSKNKSTLQYKTRNATNLNVSFKKTALGQTAFSYRGPKVWNYLNSDFKLAKNKHSFRNKLKKTILKYSNSDSCISFMKSPPISTTISKS